MDVGFDVGAVVGDAVGSVVGVAVGEGVSLVVGAEVSEGFIGEFIVETGAMIGVELGSNL